MSNEANTEMKALIEGSQGPLQVLKMTLALKSLTNAKEMRSEVEAARELLEAAGMEFAMSCLSVGTTEVLTVGSKMIIEAEEGGLDA